MKKNVFWLAAMAAAVSLTGCSVDEVVEKAEVRNIGFDAFANKSSRAATTTDQGLGHSDFSVWGKYDAVEVFQNRKVYWNGTSGDASNGSWTYDDLELWVADKNYEFAAAAPYNASFTYDYESNKYSLGEITLDATTTGDVTTYSNQTDYLVAEVKESVASGTNPVSFTFNHIVSKIDFIFKADIETTGKAWQSPVRIEIKNIKLSGVNSKNTYNNSAWGTSNTPAVEFSKSYTPVLSTTYDGVSTVTPTANVFEWLVVPQENSVTRTLEITCDVYDAVTGGTKLNSTGVKATVNITTAWVGNTYYTYTVKIGSNILGTNPYITFDVTSVAGWGTTQSETVNVEKVPNP